MTAEDSTDPEYVVGQDVDQRRVLLVGVEGGQVYPGCREGRVGGREDRERPSACGAVTRSAWASAATSDP